MKKINIIDPITLNLEDFRRECFDFEKHEVDKDKRTMVIRAATKEPIRGLSILPDAFDFARYKKNPVIMWAHNYRLPPIGKSHWVKSDEYGLRKKVEFASTAFADDILNLYVDGFLNAWSIGFNILKLIWPDDERFDELIKKWKIKKKNEVEAIAVKVDLWETSAVPIPADPNALTERIQHKDIKFHSELVLRDICSQLDFPDAAYELPGKIEGTTEPGTTDDQQNETAGEIDSELLKHAQKMAAPENEEKETSENIGDQGTEAELKTKQEKEFAEKYLQELPQEQEEETGKLQVAGENLTENDERLRAVEDKLEEILQKVSTLEYAIIKEKDEQEEISGNDQKPETVEITAGGIKDIINKAVSGVVSEMRGKVS